MIIMFLFQGNEEGKVDVKIGVYEMDNQPKKATFKYKQAYFVVVTMGQNFKTDKIRLCESVDKLKGIGKQREVKMNEINVHTIAHFQGTFEVMGCPSCQFLA